MTESTAYQRDPTKYRSTRAQALATRVLLEEGGVLGALADLHELGVSGERAVGLLRAAGVDQLDLEAGAYAALDDRAVCDLFDLRDLRATPNAVDPN
jgi:hypothetical protein